MKITRIYNAAVGATMERRFISKNSKKNVTSIDKTYYDSLVNISGPSVHSPKKIIKNWLKAYRHNIERQKIIEEIDKPFKNPSIISRIFNRKNK